jgi:hypothetical protein
MKRSPLRAKRPTPRRNEGRVQHKRMKPKAGAPPTAEEARHIERVGQMPCAVCTMRPVQVHHVTATVHGGRISRSHKRVVPLCFKHHKIEGGPLSVESLSHSAFTKQWGLDLLSLADALWVASKRLTGAF